MLNFLLTNPQLLFPIYYISYEHIYKARTYLYYLLRIGKLVDEITICTKIMKKSFYIGFFRIFTKITRYYYKNDMTRFRLREKFTTNIVSLLCGMITSSKVPFESFETLKKIDDILTIVNGFRGKFKAIGNNLKETIANTYRIMILVDALSCSTSLHLIFYTDICIDIFRFILFEFTWRHALLIFRLLRKLDDIMIAWITINRSVLILKRIDGRILYRNSEFTIRLAYITVFMALKVMRVISEIVSGVVKITKILSEGSKYAVVRLRESKQSTIYKKMNIE